MAALTTPYILVKDGTRYAITLTEEKSLLWKDHCIKGQVLVPAASYITIMGGAGMLNQGGSFGVKIHEIVISRPLEIKNNDMVIYCSHQGSGWSIEVKREGTKEQFAFCKNIEMLSSAERVGLDVHAVQKRCPAIDVNGLYQNLLNHGIQFGPNYRNLYNLHLGEEEAIARVKFSPRSPEELSLSLLHPAVIDAGIQLLGLCGMKTCGVCVPFTIRACKLFSVEDQPSELWAHAHVSSRSSNSIEGTVILFSENGDLFAVLEGLALKTLSENSAILNHLYETEWSQSFSFSKIDEPCLLLSRIPFAGAAVINDEENLESLLVSTKSKSCSDQLRLRNRC